DDEAALHVAQRVAVARQHREAHGQGAAILVLDHFALHVEQARRRHERVHRFGKPGADQGGEVGRGGRHLVARAKEGPRMVSPARGSDDSYPRTPAAPMAAGPRREPPWSGPITGRATMEGPRFDPAPRPAFGQAVAASLVLGAFACTRLP